MPLDWAKEVRLVASSARARAQDFKIFKGRLRE
jgi:hypothetical protein